MRAFNPGRPHPATILFLILATLFACPLSAQTQSSRKLIHRERALATISSSLEKVDDPPVLVSFSRISLPQRPDHLWTTEPQITPFASSKSNRSSVNLNLLLAPASAKLPAWRTNTNKDAITLNDMNRDDIDRDGIKWTEGNAASNHHLIVNSAFAPTVQSSDHEMAKYFSDPQYLAHRIPGVGSLVDRVMKQSKAHPKLTRVLESIQPQF
jgi:hypothetical protein